MSEGYMYEYFPSSVWINLFSFLMYFYKEVLYSSTGFLLSKDYFC